MRASIFLIIFLLVPACADGNNETFEAGDCFIMTANVSEYDLTLGKGEIKCIDMQPNYDAFSLMLLAKTLSDYSAANNLLNISFLVCEDQKKPDGVKSNTRHLLHVSFNFSVATENCKEKNSVRAILQNTGEPVNVSLKIVGEHEKNDRLDARILVAVVGFPALIIVAIVACTVHRHCKGKRNYLTNQPMIMSVLEASVNDDYDTEIQPEAKQRMSKLVADEINAKVGAKELVYQRPDSA